MVKSHGSASSARELMMVCGKRRTDDRDGQPRPPLHPLHIMASPRPAMAKEKRGSIGKKDGRKLSRPWFHSLLVSPPTLLDNCACATKEANVSLAKPLRPPCLFAHGRSSCATPLCTQFH
ncbi:hypothetical protein GUJ93_ZPchr0006g44675 [Zizania palustris]|uniref:Uncharacterized protein n=1 Tax=Zizania palustris TaxID=103762 RepID=A0A8J5VIH6_ZIZPA|nr:hypothetical protein GUJ93_ZPchr0006g44675 [Zizania palustris]